MKAKQAGIIEDKDKFEFFKQWYTILCSYYYRLLSHYYQVLKDSYDRVINEIAPYNFENLLIDYLDCIESLPVDVYCNFVDCKSLMEKIDFLMGYQKSPSLLGLKNLLNLLTSILTIKGKLSLVIAELKNTAE